MDPLAEKYCVFPELLGETRKVGNFEFKYEKLHYSPQIACRYVAPGTVGNGATTWHVRKLRSWGSNPMAAYQGPGRCSLPFRRTLLTTEALKMEFRETVQADYQKWRKMRNKLKKNELTEAAEEGGVSVQKEFEKRQRHNRAVVSVECTNLKIEIAQQIEKARSVFERASQALEDNTFTHDLASELRAETKRFGTSNNGLYPTMRKCAALINQKKKPGF